MPYLQLNPCATKPSVNTWYVGWMVEGWGFKVLIPTADTPSSVTVANTARVFLGSWKSLTYTGWEWIGGYVFLNFNFMSGMTNGLCYLVDINVAMS